MIGGRKPAARVTCTSFSPCVEIYTLLGVPRQNPDELDLQEGRSSGNAESEGHQIYSEEIAVMRTPWRQRQQHTAEASRCM